VPSAYSALFRDAMTDYKCFDCKDTGTRTASDPYSGEYTWPCDCGGFNSWESRALRAEAKLEAIGELIQVHPMSSILSVDQIQEILEGE